MIVKGLWNCEFGDDSEFAPLECRQAPGTNKEQTAVACVAAALKRWRWLGTRPWWRQSTCTAASTIRMAGASLRSELETVRRCAVAALLFATRAGHTARMARAREQRRQSASHSTARARRYTCPVVNCSRGFVSESRFQRACQHILQCVTLCVTLFLSLRQTDIPRSCVRTHTTEHVVEEHADIYDDSASDAAATVPTCAHCGRRFISRLFE